MQPLTTNERIALLLSVLGGDTERAALKNMHPTQAIHVRKLLEEFRNDPPSDEEVQFIVDDFTKYFSWALQSIQPDVERVTESIKADQRRSRNSESLIVEDSTDDGPVYFEPIPESDDYVDCLNQLDAFQIATALADDHPRTIAIVLAELSTPLGAAVIKNLDDELRDKAVIFFSQGVEVPAKVAQQVLQTTFRKANQILVKKSEISRTDVLAKVMRSLPKEMRSALIETLTEEDEDLVQEIRSKLYVFEDILRLEDRDTQKLISETKSDLLVLALQNASEEISAKLLNNLSKRARAALEDEIEYQNNVSQLEIDHARKELAETLGKLDEAGEITLK